MLRALRFDALTQEFLTRYPKASVVALAEGLQTSFWRLHSVRAVDNVTWYSVDLAPVIALRQKLLPPDDRVINLAISALDRQWMDRVDQSNPVLITAEGLLMYLAPDDALDLIRDCAQRFSAGQMIFDSITPNYSRRTVKGLRLSQRYTLPRMPFNLSTKQASALANAVPGVKSVRATSLPPGRGGYKLARLCGADRIGPLRIAGPTVLTFH